MSATDVSFGGKGANGPGPISSAATVETEEFGPLKKKIEDILSRTKDKEEKRKCRGALLALTELEMLLHKKELG